MNIYVLFVILAYLLGSIPTSYWVGKYFFHLDIRNHGSGNAGATNTYRVLGAKVAIPVLLIDIMKGYFAVSLAHLIPNISSETLIHYQLIFGTGAVMGHIFPIFANFRGGKGVATLTGSLLAINPLIIAFCLIVFILVVALTKMISAGSLIASLSIPFQVFFIFGIHDPFYIIFTSAFFLIVAFKHAANIRRIFAGEENTISFRKKSDQ